MPEGKILIRLGKHTLCLQMMTILRKPAKITCFGAIACVKILLDNHCFYVIDETSWAQYKIYTFNLIPLNVYHKARQIEQNESPRTEAYQSYSIMRGNQCMLQY